MKYAVYSGTRNVYELMLPSVKSVLDNSDVDKIFLLIEDDKFPVALPSCVETINVSNQPYFPPDGPNYKCRWSYMVLLRAAYCYIFPDIDKILSLDMDTIAVKDISLLWNYDISDAYFAGVVEPLKSKNYPYLNMGVTLHNLAKLRDNKAAQIINILNTTPHQFPEQDVFNIYCCGHTVQLPAEYNCSMCTEKAQEVWIRHFAAEPVEKWTKTKEYRYYNDIPFRSVLHDRR